MIGDEPANTINDRRRRIVGPAMSVHWRILLQRSLWGDKRKFLEPVMRFARGGVRDRFTQRSTFARFSGCSIFGFLHIWRMADLSVVRPDLCF